MPPGIGYGINPQIIMQALQKRGLLPNDRTSGIGQPPFVQPQGGMTPPQVSPMAGRQGAPQISRKKGGISGFLETPGVIDALMGTGSALLAQSDQPGTSFGGALGRAIPVGMQAFEYGQQKDAMRKQEEALDEFFKDAPPTMRKLVDGLSMAQKAQLAMQQMQPQEPPEVELVTLADGRVGRFVDGRFEEAMGPAEAPPAESFTYRDMPDGRIGVLQNGELINTIGEPLPDEPDFADETSLRKEFETQIGTFDEVAEAYNKVRTSASKENPNAADDMSLVFGYMKILDPGSAVREGEQASARNAGGVPDAVRSMYNRLLTEEGAPLTPNQRSNFLTAARELAESQVPLYQERATYYDSLARRMGVDPGSVIRNPFLGTDIETGNPFSDLVPGNR